MRYLLRNKDTGVVHDSVQEGKLMLTKCGLAIRAGTGRWMRTQQIDEQRISCRKCRKG